MASILDDLKALYVDAQAKLDAARQKAAWAQEQYSWNHFGGQTASQFSNIFQRDYQAPLDAAQAELLDVGTKIAKEQIRLQPTPDVPAPFASTSNTPPAAPQPTFVPLPVGGDSGGGDQSGLVAVAAIAAVGLLVWKAGLLRRLLPR